MYYDKTTKKHKESKNGSSYRKLAAALFGLSLYTMMVVLCHFDEIGMPWNCIATLMLCICNGLLSVYFYGEPEKNDNKSIN